MENTEIDSHDCTARCERDAEGRCKTKKSLFNRRNYLNNRAARLAAASARRSNMNVSEGLAMTIREALKAKVHPAIDALVDDAIIDSRRDPEAEFLREGFDLDGLLNELGGDLIDGINSATVSELEEVVDRNGNIRVSRLLELSPRATYDTLSQYLNNSYDSGRADLANEGDVL